MLDHDLEFQQLMQDALYNGFASGNRTGNDTVKIFGNLIMCDLAMYGFNLLTSKYVNCDAIMRELHWFCDGKTNIEDLVQNNVNIWNEWAAPNGELGPVYGSQWREREEIIRLNKADPQYSTKRDFLIAGDGRGRYSFEETGQYAYFTRAFDQLQYVIDRLKTHPDDRRLIVDAWNTAVLPADGVDPTEQAAIGRQALAPCHVLFQLGSHIDPDLDMSERKFHNVVFEGDKILINGYEVETTREAVYTHEGFFEAFKQIIDKPVQETRVLDMVMFQRSVDIFLGCPYNMASYAALLAYIAATTNHYVGNLKMFFGDCHIYNNQLPSVKKQLKSMSSGTTSTEEQMFVTYNVPNDLRNMNSENYRVFGYVPGPKILAPVSK